MYNVFLRDGVYTRYELSYRTFMQEYAPDKLRPKLDFGEMNEEKYKKIESEIAALNAARDRYLAERECFQLKKGTFELKNVKSNVQ